MLVYFFKKKPPSLSGRGLLGWAPGSALLSHGGPHYHRRRAVSLPRSGWDRVVPARHGRQAVRGAAPASGRGGLCPGARPALRPAAGCRAKCFGGPSLVGREGRPARLAAGRLGVIWPSLTGN